MLNNPVKFYVDASAKVIRDQPTDDELLKIELRHCYTQETRSTRMPAAATGRQLKDVWLAKFGTYTTVRLFLGGKEVHDADILKNCIIYKDMVVQVWAK
jgi:hypothetical protein